MPDEKEIYVKGFMTWFDKQSHKTLSVTIGVRLPKNYETMNEEERLWFFADHENHTLVVSNIYIENTSLETRYKIHNREGRLLELLKEKRISYGYID